MKLVKRGDELAVQADTYELKHRASDGLFVDLLFSSGVGAKFFIASGCDRDDGIDEVIELADPRIEEGADRILLTFPGRTTLWEKVEYVFE